MALLNIDVDGKLQIDSADLVGVSTAILGITRSGKSNSAAVLVEELLTNGFPMTIVDIEGEYYGLKERFQVLVVGHTEHSDLAVGVDGAAALAELSITRGIPIVLDMNETEPEEMYAFLFAYFNRLWTLSGQLRKPYQVVIEEAHEFVPQSGADRMQKPLKDLLTRFALRGGKRGLATVLISQRSPAVSKALLTQAPVVILHRVVHPTDLEAYQAIVPLPAKQVDEMVGKLGTGEAIVLFNHEPKIVRIRKRTTFHAGATPTFGQDQAPVLQPIDASLLADLKSLTKTGTVGRADQTEQLRKRIQELEQRQPQRIEIPVLKDEQVSQLQLLADQAIQQGQALLEFGQTILMALQRVEGPAMPDHEETTAAKDDDDLHLRDGEIRILKAIAQRHPTRLTRSQIGTLSGFTPSGGTFSNYYSHLKRESLIEEIDGLTSITADGFDFLGTDVPSRPQTTEELLAMWRGALRAGEAKMLDALVSCYPRYMTRGDLGNSTGYTASGGTFGNYLGTLRRNGLVETTGDMVRASETLFISGSGRR